MKSLHCIVTGKVQGGTFQGWLHGHAERLGLTGFVRNVADGKAEIIAQGNESNFDEFKRLIEQEAPISDAKTVEAKIMDHDKTYSVFEMRG